MENAQQIAGLAIFLSLTSLTVYLNVRRRISDLMAAALLVFTLLSAGAVANADRLWSGTLKASGMENHEREMIRIREEAMEGLLAQWNRKKEELDRLSAEINASSEKFREEREAMDSALEDSRQMMAGRQEWQNQMLEFQNFAEASQDELIAIHNVTAQIALVLTRLIYLQVEGNRHLPMNQENPLRQQVLDGLDELVSLAIPDPLHREAFVEDVIESVHEGQDWITGN